MGGEKTSSFLDLEREWEWRKKDRAIRRLGVRTWGMKVSLGEEGLLEKKQLLLSLRAEFCLLGERVVKTVKAETLTILSSLPCKSCFGPRTTPASWSFCSNKRVP